MAAGATDITAQGGRARNHQTPSSTTTNNMSPTTIKIWGRGNSANVKKALWTAEELGVAYESIPAGGAHGRNGEIVAIGNPNGLVPTIQDGEFVLWESAAIVRYLGQKYDTAGEFFPADAQARASADKWLEWAPTLVSCAV